MAKVNTPGKGKVSGRHAGANGVVFTRNSDKTLFWLDQKAAKTTLNEKCGHLVHLNNLFKSRTRPNDYPSAPDTSWHWVFGQLLSQCYDGPSQLVNTMTFTASSPGCVPARFRIRGSVGISAGTEVAWPWSAHLSGTGLLRLHSQVVSAHSHPRIPGARLDWL